MPYIEVGLYLVKKDGGGGGGELAGQMFLPLPEVPCAVQRERERERDAD